MALSIHELHQFDALREEWNTLWRSSTSGASIFSSFDWQRIWWEVFGSNAELRLLSVRDGTRLIGIWPLMADGHSVRLVGGAEVCDYLDVIASAGREQQVIQAGLDYLTCGGEQDVDLRFIRASSSTVSLLPAIGDSLGWQTEQSVDDVCPTITLPDSWDAYLGTLSRKDRHELRRKLRRLSESAKVEWQIATGRDNIEQDIDDFVRLHRLSRPDKAAFMDGAMEHFFGSIIRAFRPCGAISIYFLALEGRRVATVLCFDQQDELWVYNSGFDREYGALSVGLAVKAYCVRDAIEKGKRKVDFLRGPEPYKYDLGAQDVPAYRLRLGRR